MLDTLYLYFRLASGFALIVGGAVFLIEPGRQRPMPAFGVLFISIGSLFTYSIVGPLLVPPAVPDNALVIALIFALSQSFYEIILYLFGAEARQGSRRRVYLAGALWSLALALLPILDLVLGLPAVAINIEDGRTLPPFLLVAGIAIYAWPLVITFLAFAASPDKPIDTPLSPGGTRPILAGLGIIILLLIGIVGSLLAGAMGAYRAFHSALQALMLAWYLYIRAHPDLFLRAREAIGTRHRERNADHDARGIELGLAKLVAEGSATQDPDLDLQALARALGVPAYRLSAYMNDRLGRNFSDWLNERRIDHARRLLDDRSNSSILSIAFEVGYSSKTVFNTQFRRRVGTTPREYRNRARPGE